MNKFEIRLRQEKDLLEKELGDIAHKDQKNPDNWEAIPDAKDEVEFHDDITERMETFAARQETTDTLEVRLKNVNDALVQIAAGTYGRCKACQTEIEPERLEANPAAQTCKAHLNQG